jgi:hypothetical protein
MGAIIGFKDIIGGATITLVNTGSVTALVLDGALANLKYRSLARNVTITASDFGTGGEAIVRCACFGNVRVAALAGVAGASSENVSAIECRAYNGATLLETVSITGKALLLDEQRESLVVPFVFSTTLDVSRIDFVFAIAPGYPAEFSIGRAVAMRGVYLAHGFGRDWEIDHDDTSEVAYVGRYGSPSVLRGATFRKITAPIPLASETLLFGDGLTTSYNQNLDDFVRYVGRGDDVLIVPRTSASAGDLFKQRASILGLLDNPLPNFKHRAGRLWNTSITVREAR